MAKKLSSEDGNLSSSIALSAKTKKYKDIDISLQTFSDTGDIYLKTDASSVKQSIRNLLLANKLSKPFNPKYGADLQSLLFDLSTGNSDYDIQRKITNAINIYEPRAKIKSIKVTTSPDQYTARVRLEFGIVNTPTIDIIETTISRLR